MGVDGSLMESATGSSPAAAVNIEGVVFKRAKPEKGRDP
jgi:hypothetical protein